MFREVFRLHRPGSQVTCGVFSTSARVFVSIAQSFLLVNTHIMVILLSLLSPPPCSPVLNCKRCIVNVSKHLLLAMLIAVSQRRVVKANDYTLFHVQLQWMPLLKYVYTAHREIKVVCFVVFTLISAYLNLCAKIVKEEATLHYWCNTRHHHTVAPVDITHWSLYKVQAKIINILYISSLLFIIILL